MGIKVVPSGEEKLDRRELLQRVKEAVLEIEPGAEIILFGSRARGDDTPESDWDFLILVDGPVNTERQRTVRHRLYEIEWDSGEVISSIVRGREVWESPLHRAMPFHENISRDGVSL
ncbi:MAG: nucleotidyltransferase domain-containing protein [Thermodesulfobacteriota bacterium]